MSRRVVEVAVSVTLGALAVMAVAFMLDRGGDAPVEAATTVGSVDLSRTAGDIDAFLSDMTRHRTGTYAVDGSVTETTNAGDTTVSRVRTVRLGGQSLEQFGSVTVVTADGREQVCDEVLGEIECGPIEPAPLVADEISGLEALLTGDAPDYQLYEGPAKADARCWTLLATAANSPDLYGQASDLCFDRTTGALVESTTSTTRATRHFTVDRLTAEVAVEDLDPGWE